MTGKEENTILNLRGSIRAAAALAAQSVVTPLNCNTLSSSTRAHALWGPSSVVIAFLCFCLEDAHEPVLVNGIFRPNRPYLMGLDHARVLRWLTVWVCLSLLFVFRSYTIYNISYE